ncbi:hypothetical protein Baya_6618 [Bagarius yarrelli]|uniref:Uncharacterized protein n=1 Tax=Bagarius yarrelli TaxID=175774 RepID=A0A556U1D5_BAGYA|nr:hypothetical protein Baya_6618 [Bagarius yarrelli]
MSGGERLFRCEDPAVWRGVYEKYWAVVEAKAAGKRRNSEKLVELEKWYQEELPALILARTERSLTHSELVKLMEWKLTRGKFRPRLKQLISSNSKETVLLCTKKAFAILPDVQSAIAELSTLKGLGPATASGNQGHTKVDYIDDYYFSADSQHDWTAHKVELCLWAFSVASQVQPSLLEAFALSDYTNRETDKEETMEQPSKRRKKE